MDIHNSRSFLIKSNGHYDDGSTSAVVPATQKSGGFEHRPETTKGIDAYINSNSTFSKSSLSSVDVQGQDSTPPSKVIQDASSPVDSRIDIEAGKVDEDERSLRNRDLIAIVGIGCRFPGEVSSPSEFWQMLYEGRSGQAEVPISRFNVEGFYNPDPNRHRDLHTRGGYFLGGDPRCFDNGFLGINNLEATYMDPQQRKLLEVVYECFENGGLPLDRASGANIGCYVGNFTVDYEFMQGRDLENAHRYIATGMGTAMLANRLSHVFNLRGPSVVMDTACSSSLYGLHAACAALRARDCDGAIVAGANLIQSPDQQLATDKAGVLSPTSTCHAFDAAADGYGRGEAIGAIYIKRLEDAMRDKDSVRSVIMGSAVNSNGRTSGITQPSVRGQEEVIRRAYAQAGLPRNETEYVECHGTGTAVGDPVEVEALTQVLQPRSGQNILIGSVKTNIGHSEAASGLASVIKVTLSLEKKNIPSTFGFKNPNPNIFFSDWNCEVLQKPRKWPELSSHSRASINSFGYGGANAHLILEAPLQHLPDAKLFSRPKGSSYLLLPFSAHSESVLKAMLAQIPAWALKKENIADFEYTLSDRRSRFRFRSYVIASMVEGAPHATVQKGSMPQSISLYQAAKVAFVFTGQGAQWPGMGRELLAAYPTFSRTIEELDDYLANAVNPPDWLLKDIFSDSASEEVHLATVSQTACTALQLGLINLLRDFGIIPSAVVGHSSGEIAAAYAAGYIPAQQAILTAYYRGLAVGRQVRNGGMISVGLAESAARESIQALGMQNQVCVACINSPDNCTLSGDAESIFLLLQNFQSRGIFARRLRTDNKAYHSQHMGGEVLRRYEELLSTVFEKQPDRIPSEDNVKMCSSSRLDTVTRNDTARLAYWTNNLSNPVNFEAAVDILMSNAYAMIIEIGPHPVMALPFQQICGRLANTPTFTYAHTLERGKHSVLAIIQLAGKCFQNSVDVSMAKANARPSNDTGLGMLKDLPPYPWQYENVLWKECRTSCEFRNRKHRRHELLGSLMPGTSGISFTWRNILVANEIPWLADHKLNETVVFPAAGFIALVVEAVCQISERAIGTSHRVTLKQMKILEALQFLDEDFEVELFTEIQPSQLTMTTRSNQWWNFTISTFSNGSATRHANGLVRTQDLAEPGNQHSIRCTPAITTSSRVWYQRLIESGLNFGPSFQSTAEINMDPGMTKPCVMAKIGVPPNDVFNKRCREYEVHPITIDALFQTAIIATFQGQRSHMRAKVPVSFGTFTLSLSGQASIEQYTAMCTSDVAGFGSDICHGSLLDHDHRIVCKVEDSRFVTYSGSSLRQYPDNRHPMLSIEWRPDLKSTGYGNFARVLRIAVSNASTAHKGLPAEYFAAIDLIAHKKAITNILEVGQCYDNVSTNILKCLQSGGAVRRCDLYSRASASSAKSNSEVVRLNDSGFLEPVPPLASSGRSGFNVVLVTTTCNAHQLRKHLVEMQEGVEPDTSAIFLAPVEQAELLEDFLDFKLYFAPTTQDVNLAIVLAQRVAPSSDVRRIQPGQLFFLRNDNAVALEDSLRDQFVQMLGTSATEVSLGEINSMSIPPGATVVSTLEVGHPFMLEVSSQIFEELKNVTNIATNILWLSDGDTRRAKGYHSSLIQGLARALMMEHPALKFVTFDMGGPFEDPAETPRQALGTFCEAIDDPFPDLEFAYSEGITYCSRFIQTPDMNQEFRTKQGDQPVPVKLRDAENFRLTIHLADGSVEIQVSCVGLNAKDYYGLTGVIDTRHGTCNLEFTGIVTAIADDVKSVAVGDKVVCMAPNHFQAFTGVPEWACRRLFNSESHSTISTIPVVFSTAIYALQHRARLRSGESVLIHSAAGGLGLAAIQIARNIGAEIYATAGTAEKRRFLVENHGLARDHVFSSREPELLPRVLEATGGRGVDVVLNSLTGDLLRDSWKACADFGRFVEVGKKDILEAGLLDMEVFKRSVTFTAFDLTDLYYSTAQQEIWTSLIDECMHLYRSSKISPVQLTHMFDCADVVQAFRHFGSRDRIGKIAVSMENNNSTIMMEPSRYSTVLDGSKSYLMVGCFGGLGRSLATWMAHRGARYFTFLSRSGVGDETSQSFQLIKRLEGLSCAVSVIKGDVAVLKDVEAAVKQLPGPLGGIINAAMGLHESLFVTMTWDGWMKAIRPKVDGSWNLHTAIKGCEDDLDFFVSTGSISGSVGTATESNYCAANSFLDGFARWRRTKGLKATSLGLGMISEVGYLHEHPEIEALLLRKGIHPINEDELLQIFDIALAEQRGAFQSNNPHQIGGHILTGLEPTSLSNQRSRGFEGHSHVLDDPRAMNILRLLRQDETTPDQARTGAVGSNLSKELEQAMHEGPEALKKTVFTLIVKKLSNLVLVDAGDLHGHQLLGGFGMDSMLAAEFRTHVFHVVGVEIPFLMLLEKSTSIQSLSDFVVGELDTSGQ